MDAIINLEMTGPLAGVLHQQAASSPSDFLAMIFGNRSLRDVRKASDSQSENVVSTIEMQIEGWVVIDIREVFEVKTKAFKKVEMKKFLDSRVGVFLGFMRLRKNWHWPVQPSYQDQLLFDALKLESMKWPKVLHLVFEVVHQGAGVGAGLGVPLSRLTSTTQIAYMGNTSKIPLKVPNLGGVSKPYKERRRKGSLMTDLEAQAGLHEEKVALAKMKEKFIAMQNLLEKRSKQKAREVVHLQRQVKALEDEVEQLERRRELRLEEGADLKRVRALQGPVEVALQQVIKEMREGEVIEIVEKFVTPDQPVEEHNS